MKVKKYEDGGPLPRLVAPTDRQLKRNMRRAYRRGGADEAMARLNEMYQMPDPESGEDVITGEELRSLNRMGAAMPALGSLGALLTAYQNAKRANDPMNRFDPSLRPGPLASLMERIFGMTQ